MPGVIDTLRIVYSLDVVDHATKPMLASERAVQKSVVQTSRTLQQKDAAVRRSATVTSTSTTRSATALQREGRAAGAAATQVTQLTRAERAVANETNRAAGATNRAAAANDRLARSARRVRTAEATRIAPVRAAARTRRPEGVVSSSGNLASSARSNVGIGAVVAGAVGVSQAVKFDKALRNVNSIAGLTEKQLQAVAKALLGLAGKTAQAPVTLAEGMYDLVSSGFDAEESLHIVEKAARAATAGLSTTEVSTKAVAAVLNAYRLPASQAGKVSDQLFKTVDRGVISFEQLASGIGPVLPIAASLGVGLDQVGAALATMTKQGLGPEESVVRLTGAMNKFIKPSDDMKEALKKIGAESGEQLIRQKGLQGAIEAVAGATDGSKEAFAKLFPDVRAMQGALALTGKNAKSAKDDLKGMADSGGATQRALAQQSKSTAYQWNQLKAAAQALGITVGSKLLPQLNSAIRSFSDLPGPVKIAIGALAGTALAIGPINKLRKNTMELGSSIVSVGRRAAKSRIAVSLAEGASGAAGKMRNALKGVPGAIRNLLSRGGRNAGAAAAESAASSAGAGMGPALDRHRKAFTGGRWRTMGRMAGRTFGLAGAAYAIWTFKDELNKAPKTDLGKYLFAPLNFGKSLGRKLGELLGTNAKRRGGVVEHARRFQGGGLVPIAAAGGELLVDRGRAMTIPGRDDQDGTLLMARPGSAVVTYDGQARMAAGASLAQAIRLQAPHFAKGGVIPGKYTATAYGPPWGGIQGTGITKTGVNLKNNPRLYGIATDPRMIPLGSKVFAHPNPFGYTGRFSAFDTGGAIKGRHIDFYDWRGRKQQNRWGRRPVTISRARIAPRQGGDDVYRAPGGGASETAVTMLGRNPRRGGLLGDAFAQGRAAGQSGLTLSQIKRDGSPVTQAIIEAIRGAGTQPDKGGAARKAESDKLTEIGNYRAGTRMARMHAKAAAIDAKRYQYAWGGGHGRIGVPTVGSRTPRGGKRGLGYDCSGAVSAVLGAGGLLKSPLTSGGLMGWGRKGSGKNLAIHTDPGHVIMRIGRRFWGTGEANPNGGAGWLPRNTMRGRGVTRTWPGMRHGGIVGYAKGGIVARARRAEKASAERWPRVHSLIRSVWGAQRDEMGVRGSSPAFKIGQTKHRGVTFSSQLKSGLWTKRIVLDVDNIARRLLRKHEDGSTGDPSAFRTVVHEFAHAAQRGDLKGHEPEGGATVFADRYSARIARRVGYPYSKPRSSPYPREASWVRKNRSSEWVKRGQFRSGRNVNTPFKGNFRFRTGGTVGAGPALTGGLGRAMTFGGGTFEALDEVIQRAAEARLAALRRQVAARVQRGGSKKIVDRLRGVLDLIDSELGRRVGRVEDVIEQRTTQLDRGRGAVDRALRERGIPAESVTGLGVMAVQQAAETRVRQQNITSLQRALRTATRARNREAIRDLTGKLHQAQDELHESLVRQVELWRDKIRALGSNAVSNTQFGLGWNQTNMGLVETHQRQYGYQDTPRAMTERAQYLQTAIAPMLEAARAAHLYNAQMLAGIGDVDGWRQAMQDAHSTTLELANAQADAADLMRDAARRAAQELVSAAQFALGWYQANMGELEAHQRLYNYQDTSRGMRERAERITTGIIPALQAALEAHRANAEALGSTGDIEGWRQAMLDAKNAAIDITNAQADAAELMREAARELVQDLTGASQFGLAWYQANMGELEAHQRLQGYQDTSGGMRERADSITTGIIPALQAALEAHRANAEALGSTGDIDGWRQAMLDARNSTIELMNAQSDAADLMREAAQKVVGAIVNRAQFVSSWEDQALERLELEQRLIGTHGTPGGAAGRADFIQSRIIPAIQAEITALEQQRVLAEQQRDTDLVQQLWLQIFSKQTEVLRRQLDAQEQTAENTDLLKTMGGSTAFSYRDQVYTDNSPDVIAARLGA